MSHIEEGKGFEHDLTSSGLIIPAKFTPNLPSQSSEQFTLATKTYHCLPGNIYITVNGIKDPELTNTDLQLLWIKYNDIGKVTIVTQNVGNSLLRCFLEHAPEGSLVFDLKRHIKVGAPDENDIAIHTVFMKTASDRVRA